MKLRHFLKVNFSDVCDDRRLKFGLYVPLTFYTVHAKFQLSVNYGLREILILIEVLNFFLHKSNQK